MWTPSSVAFGIQHKRLFGFLGKAGEIADALIALQQDKFFPDESFKSIGWPSQVSLRIANDDQTFFVDCNLDGVVLNVDLEGVAFTREKAKRAFARIASIVLKISGGWNSVTRVGIVDNYEFTHDHAAKIATKTLTTLHDLGEPGDFAFRVAFRSPTQEGYIKGDVHDWKNTIIQVRTDREENDDEKAEVKRLIKVNIDYQQYYSPERQYVETLLDEHFKGFLTRIGGLQATALAGLESKEVVVAKEAAQ